MLENPGYLSFPVSLWAILRLGRMTLSAAIVAGPHAHDKRNELMHSIEIYEVHSGMGRRNSVRF
jgi:hypothetical protein